jgi:membrane-bound lytic murein transglycosylase D
MQSIAKHYGLSLKQIMASNSLKNNKVKIGQTLKVGSETVSAKSTKHELNSKPKGKISNKKTGTNRANGKKSNTKSGAKTKVSKKSAASSSSKNIVSAKKTKRHK